MESKLAISTSPSAKLSSVDRALLRDVDVVEAFDLHIARDLDAIGAVLEPWIRSSPNGIRSKTKTSRGAVPAAKRVVARPAGHPRAAAAGVQPVAAFAALDLVEAAAAAQPVVAFVALELVPAGAAADPVAALAALDLVRDRHRRRACRALPRRRSRRPPAPPSARSLPSLASICRPRRAALITSSAVERDELVVLAGADEPVVLVGADQPADPGLRDQRPDLLPAQRSVADCDEGVVEVAVEAASSSSSLLMLARPSSNATMSTLARPSVERARVLAGDRVEEVEAVAVADRVEGADRQQVALGVGDDRRDAVVDGRRAGRVGRRVVAVVEVGDVARSEVAEEEASVLVVLELDPDLLDIGDKEQAERLAGRSPSSSRARPPRTSSVSVKRMRASPILPVAVLKV